MSIDEASAAETSELRHRFQKYQDFLEDTVLPDLAKATQSEAKIDEEQRTYRALDNGVRALMAESADPLRILVDVGEGIHMLAEVPQGQSIFVNAGLGFHVECSYAEALQLIEMKKKHLHHKKGVLHEQTASILDNARTLQQCLSELEGLLLASA